MTLWKRFAARVVRRLADDERGAIAVQFALLLIPIAIITFGLIDVSRASVQKRQLQDALDAATLMAARSTATTDSGLDTIGDAALQTEMSGFGLTLTNANSTFATGTDNTVVGTVSVVIKPIISNLWSTGDSTVTATSTVSRSLKHLEVALVLDNTGSMASSLGSGGSKISALITASKSLVDTLATAADRASDADAVKISVVPFSMTVNVGSTYQNSDWIKGAQPTEYGTDLFNDDAHPNRFTLLSNMKLTWSGCIESRPAPYDITDEAPYSAKPASYFVPFFAPDEPDSSYKVYSNSNNTKTTSYSSSSNNDYLYDYGSGTNPYGSETAFLRRQGLTTKYASGNIKSSSASDVDGGPNDGCGITSLLRLTTVKTASKDTVKNKLSQMVASGNTNVAMGLMWGWHTLSKNAPFADGVDPTTTTGKKTTKIIVLLTDGDNTNDVYSNANASIYTGYGYIWQGRLLNAINTALTTSSSATDRRDAIDSREAKVCTAAKAAGVQIYAIGVGVSSHSKGILQACATSTDMYYDVTASSQLSTVFNTIAGSIQNLRITK